MTTSGQDEANNQTAPWFTAAGRGTFRSELDACKQRRVNLSKQAASAALAYSVFAASLDQKLECLRSSFELSTFTKARQKRRAQGVGFVVAEPFHARSAEFDDATREVAAVRQNCARSVDAAVINAGVMRSSESRAKRRSVRSCLLGAVRKTDAPLCYA